MSLALFMKEAPLFANDAPPVSALVAELKALNSRAARTAPKYISIYRSTVPNAGLGAFATDFIPKGVVLGEYRGHIYPSDTQTRAHDEYMFEVRPTNKRKRPFLISARQYNVWPYTWIRFVNAQLADADQNTEFFQSHNRIWLRTLRPIFGSPLAPVELFAHYGAMTDDFVDSKKPKQQV